MREYIKEYITLRGGVEYLEEKEKLALVRLIKAMGGDQSSTEGVFWLDQKGKEQGIYFTPEGKSSTLRGDREKHKDKHPYMG